MEENFEINCEMPFGDGQVYIVGFDTMGEGVRFYNCCVCHNNSDLNDEIYRVISEMELEASKEISLEEQIVIAELKETPPLNYREYVLEKKYK